MDEKKQIDEMVRHCPFYKEGKCMLLEAVKCDANCDMCDFAKRLYNANFRKQSEGEWVANPHISISKRGRTIHYETFKCSVCGKWNGRKKQKYCPNCGAKMKGGADQ